MKYEQQHGFTISNKTGYYPFTNTRYQMKKFNFEKWLKKTDYELWVLAKVLKIKL